MKKGGEENEVGQLSEARSQGCGLCARWHGKSQQDPEHTDGIIKIKFSKGFLFVGNQLERQEQKQEDKYRDPCIG